MTKIHTRVNTSNGQIHAMTCTPLDQFSNELPTVIFSHGFTVPGFESRRMFIDMAERLLARNWQAVLFDYRGSGYSDLSFTDMVIQMEFEDLSRIMDYVASITGNRGWTALWGMSLGTAVVAEVASQRQGDVDAIVLWGLSAELYERFSPRYVDDFERKGYSILDSGFTVKPSLVEGMKGVDTYASLRSIASVPRLFVAGESDSATEMRMSEHAVREAHGDCSIMRIPNGVHGFKGQPELYEQAISGTLSWLDSKYARR